MSADFLTAFAKLPARQQRGVRAMIARFERDSTASGLNYEKITNAKDSNIRSLRINGGYRAIVLKPAQGNVHMLLWADKHDDAYLWATRHRCSINAENRSIAGVPASARDRTHRRNLDGRRACGLWRPQAKATTAPGRAFRHGG